MKTKNGFSLFNIISIVVFVLILISSAVAMHFIGGYTSKNILLIIPALAIGLITNSIHHFFIKQKKDNDEREINIDNKAKAMAFDVMGIIFGILIIIYAFMKANMLTSVLVIIAYLLIFVVYMVFFGKYHKDM